VQEYGRVPKIKEIMQVMYVLDRNYGGYVGARPKSTNKKWNI
jgi:hypothetical protein